MAGYELATAYVTLAVESSQIAKAIGAGFAGGDKIAAKSGKSMGKSMGEAFSKEKGPDFDKLAADAEKADKRVQVSADQVARKRGDAARQIEIAEQKVLETREKSIARDKDVIDAEKQLAAARKQGDPDDVAAAEDRLARARDGATPTSADMAAEDRLAKAKRSYIDVSRDGVQTLSRFAKEQDQANSKLTEAKRAADGAENSTEKAAGAFGRLGGRVKDALKGDFKNAFRRVEAEGEDAAEEIERDFKKSGSDSAKGFGSNFKAGFAGALGGLTTYFGLSEALDFGKYAISGAADLEQSIGGVETVFKDSAKQMLAWSDAADQSLGLTSNEYNEFAAKLGASLKNAGTPMDELGGKTNDLIAKGADLASLYGGTTAEAVDALGSALRGEMDPIERYGITLNDAALTAEGLAMGIKKTGGSFSTQEKQLITMSLLQKQSADATGNFAREQNTASNVAQRLTAKLKETATEIGGNLTPYLANLGSWFLDKGIPALEDFGNGVKGVWDILVNGDYKGPDSLFGLEEDAPIVGILFDLREAVMGFADEWGNVVQSIDWSGFVDGAKGVGEWFLNDGIPALTAFITALGELPGWIQQNQAWLTTLGVSLGIAGGAAWIASGGLAAVGLSIQGVFLSISTGIKAIPVIGWVIAAIGLLVTALVWFFTQTELGQEIWAKVWAGIKTAAGAVVGWFVNTAWPALKTAWDAIASAAVWLWQNALVPAWGGIQTAISATVDWLVNTAWPVIKGVWDAIAGAAIWLWQSVIQPVWNGIKLAIAIAVTAILVYIDLLKWYWQSVIAPTAMWLWNNVMKPVWNGIKSAIGAVVDWFVKTAWPTLKASWDAVASAANWLWRGVLQPAWNGIKSAINAVVTWFRDTAWPIFSSVISWIATKFDQFKVGLGVIWGYIKNNVISPVVSWFQNTAWPLISSVIDSIKRGFGLMRDSLKAVWGFVKDSVVAPVVNWFTGTVQPKLEGVTDKITSAFDTMKQGVKKAWDGIKDAARAPVKFVVEDVYNASLRETFNGVANKLELPEKWRLPPASLGFAGGGVMPGYTPGRDVHQFISPTGGRLDLSGGEAIMRPEWTRAVGGPAAVADMNRRARRGEAFAGGGVWGRIKGIGGDAIDWMADKASAVSEAFNDPFGALTKLATAAVGLIPGGGMVHASTVQVGKNAGEMIGGWLKDQVFSSESGGGSVPQGGAGGSGWAKAANAASQLGLVMTSGSRPGARTAGSGSVSMHALGRARDYAGPASAMSKFFDQMNSAPYPTELLYTPKYGRNIHRGGGRYANTGATARNHWNHVHVAFREGGVFGSQPYLHDEGGWHNPGELSVNQTRKPEAVLTDAQWATMARLSEQNLARPDGALQIGTVQGYTAEEVAEQIEKKRRQREALYSR